MRASQFLPPWDLVGLLGRPLLGLLLLLLPLLGPPVQGPLPGGLASLQGLLGQVAPLQGLRQEPLALRPGRLAQHAYPKYVALDLVQLPLLLLLGLP